MYGVLDRHRGNEDHSRKDGLPTIAVVEGPESYREHSPGDQELDFQTLVCRCWWLF
jgi:hypothetical protein